MIRNEITLTTNGGEDVFTLRRFALKVADFSGITGRRHMLNLRRKEQLSRKSYGHDAFRSLTAAQRKWRNRGYKADSQESRRRVAQGYR